MRRAVSGWGWFSKKNLVRILINSDRCLLMKPVIHATPNGRTFSLGQHTSSVGVVHSQIHHTSILFYPQLFLKFQSKPRFTTPDIAKQHFKTIKVSREKGQTQVELRMHQVLFSISRIKQTFHLVKKKSINDNISNNRALMI